MTAVAEHSAAAWIARSLKARGVTRVFALCGGHVMPIWMRLDAEGIAIVDVRDERAAVYMAHAHAELTGGLGVALVTAGPGVTNAMTGIANAHVARASVLVLSGVPPRPQENRGALQDMDFFIGFFPISISPAIQSIILIFHLMCCSSLLYLSAKRGVSLAASACD